MGTNKYALLHPLTGEHLRVVITTGRKQGLCVGNGIDFYVSVPHYVTRKAGIFSRLSVAQQNAYLAAMVLASEFRSMLYPVKKLEWRTGANLTRKYFRPAVEHLNQQGLLSYDGKTLMLFDPETREEARRSSAGSDDTKRLYIKGGKNWLDYDTVTGEQWEGLMADLLHRKFQTRSDGWTKVGPCPFAHHSKEVFSLNFDLGCFNCFACKQGGKLSRIVKHINGTDDRQTKLFIAEHCGVILQDGAEPPPPETQEPATATVSTHEGI
jgi:hypothetical protein